MKFFGEELRGLGIAESRVDLIRDACDRMHAAFCRLDGDGQEVISGMGFSGLMDLFVSCSPGLRPIQIDLEYRLAQRVTDEQVPLLLGLDKRLDSVLEGRMR